MWCTCLNETPSCLWRCISIFYTKIMCCAKNFKNFLQKSPKAYSRNFIIYVSEGTSIVLNDVLSYKCSRYKSGTIINEFLVQFDLILVGSKPISKHICYTRTHFIIKTTLVSDHKLPWPKHLLGHHVVRKQDGSSKKIMS